MENKKRTKFHHIKFLVHNSLQASDWHVTRFGFKRFAFKKNNGRSSHVVKQGEVILWFESFFNAINLTNRIGVKMENEIEREEKDRGEEYKEYKEYDDYLKFVKRGGDGVSDIAFEVDDCRACFEESLSRGASPLQQPTTLRDSKGEVVISRIKSPVEGISHSFVERKNYDHKLFLPGFDLVEERRAGEEDPLSHLFGQVKLEYVDHAVQNVYEGEMEGNVEWYENVLQFERFYSVDSSLITTKQTSLSTVALSTPNPTIRDPKLLIAEPSSATTSSKSQISEFLDFNGGRGVQHIALFTSNIIHSISSLKKRGVEFIRIPPLYFLQLKERLLKEEGKMKERLFPLLEKFQELGLLVDFDDKGFLMQIFTKPTNSRPTFFYEIIQRENNTSFGARNILALFQVPNFSFNTKINVSLTLISFLKKGN